MQPSDIPGVDESVARRLLATARSITPCLDELDGEGKATAIAILAGVAAELPLPGSRRVRSQSRNGTSVAFDSFTSAWSAEDRAALRGLCGHSHGVASAGIPAGVFPRPGVVERQWPERYES